MSENIRKGDVVEVKFMVTVDDVDLEDCDLPYFVESNEIDFGTWLPAKYLSKPGAANKDKEQDLIAKVINELKAKINAENNAVGKGEEAIDKGMLLGEMLVAQDILLFIMEHKK